MAPSTNIESIKHSTDSQSLHSYSVVIVRNSSHFLIERTHFYSPGERTDVGATSASPNPSRMLMSFDETEPSLEDDTSLTSVANSTSPSSFTALKLQRKQRLESLIEKRKNNFLYLMEIHLGGSYWLNSVLIDKKELHSYILEKPSTRAVMYYYFGISISKILELNSGPITIKAMIQLLEEWEYYFASTTMQSMKYMMARTSNYIYPNFMPNDTSTTAGAAQSGNGSNNPNSVESDHQIKSGIYKFNNDVVYEYLLTPHIPFELNYIEVLYSLCQMLYDLYDKFWHEDSFRYAAISLFLLIFAVVSSPIMTRS